MSSKTPNKNKYSIQNTSRDIESNPTVKTLEIITNEKGESQLSDYSSYYSTEQKKCWSIPYYKIGNMYAFNFNSRHYPKFIIGPHWYLYLGMNIAIGVISSFLYLKFLILIWNIWFTLWFASIVCAWYYVYSMNFLWNPGVVMNKISWGHDYNWCEKCMCYNHSGSSTIHCDFCGVCIEKMDHHCVWVGKCVGKKMIIWFYGWLVMVGLLYMFIIGSVIAFYIMKNNN